MTLRSWLFLLITICAAYGAATSIALHYGLEIVLVPLWLAVCLYYTVPWLTILCGFVCWRKARQWRIMYDKQHINPIARGAYAMPLPRCKPGAQEKWAWRVMLLGIAAIPYHLSLPHPGRIAVIILIALWVLGRCFASLGKPQQEK